MFYNLIFEIQRIQYFVRWNLTTSIVPKLYSPYERIGIYLCQRCVAIANFWNQNSGFLIIIWDHLFENIYTKLARTRYCRQRVKPINSSILHFHLIRVTKKANYKYFSVNSEQQKIVSKLYIPELKMKGNYKLSGQLLMLPIEGEGQFSGNYGKILSYAREVSGSE